MQTYENIPHSDHNRNRPSTPDPSYRRTANRVTVEFPVNEAARARTAARATTADSSAAVASPEPATFASQDASDELRGIDARSAQAANHTEASQDEAHLRAVSATQTPRQAPRGGARGSARPQASGHAPKRHASASPENGPGQVPSSPQRREHPHTAQAHGGPARKAPQAVRPTAKKSRYIPSLDGLRTLAVLAVIAYHMNIPWMIGGLAGVTIFFVLSGYLITSLLVAEWERAKTIDLPQFWLRRVRRLFPAIVTAILATAALCTIFNHELLTKMRPDIIPSLLFFNNWWQIFQDISYFEALGAPSPLTAFWSLAIEEQFYLVWPVALLIALKLGAKRTHIVRAIVVLIIVSSVEMALLYNPGADPSRVYYGTDTRAFSLLIGALLAFLWPSADLGMHGARRIDKRTRMALDGVGAAALIGLLLMLMFSSGFSAFPYRGGMVITSLLTAVLIAVLVHPESHLARVFAWSPLVWIGKRSYGMYLWHYPILLLMIPRATASQAPWWMLVLAFAVIIAVSAISYAFVEDPIRKGALGRIAREIRSGAETLADVARTHIPQIACTVALAAIGIGGIAFVPPTHAMEGAEALKEAEEQQSDPTAAIVDTPAAEPYTVLLIGDSVSVRAVPYFEEQFPGGHIDAAVSRQLYTGQQIYQYYADQDIVGDVVVFALGTNGPATDDQLDELIAAVGSEKSIYLVNTRSPQLWMSTTNQAIANAVSRYNNVYLIDWYSYSEGRDDVFDGDGTHLTETGAQDYVALIRDTIAATTGLPVEPSPEELAERQAQLEQSQAPAQEEAGAESA